MTDASEPQDCASKRLVCECVCARVPYHCRDRRRSCRSDPYAVDGRVGTGGSDYDSTRLARCYSSGLGSRLACYSMPAQQQRCQRRHDTNSLSLFVGCHCRPTCHLENEVAIGSMRETVRRGIRKRVLSAYLAASSTLRYADTDGRANTHENWRSKQIAHALRGNS